MFERVANIINKNDTNLSVIYSIKIFNEYINAVQRGCFIGSTLIYTVNGNIPIKDVKIGDLVYSYDMKTNTFVKTKVKNSWLSKKNMETWKITFKGNKEFISFYATPDHKFLNLKNKYIQLKDLKENDLIKGIYYSNRKKKIIFNGHMVNTIAFSHYEDVYDIETETGNFIITNNNENIIVSNSKYKEALMLCLDIWHSEIIDFINLKNNLKELVTINTFILINDEFMKQLKESPNSFWEFKNLRTNKYSEKDCNGKKYTVKEIWDLIITSIHDTGKPGLIFIDEINKYNFINSSKVVTIKDISNIYLMAYDKKCKRINDKKIKEKKPSDVMPCIKVTQKTPFGTMHVKIVIDPYTEKEIEIFASLGKVGENITADLEGICRIGSLFMKNGGNIIKFVNQLEGIGSNSTITTKDDKISSLPDALATAIKKYLSTKLEVGLNGIFTGQQSTSKRQIKKNVKKDFNVYREKCQCGADLLMQEGCVKCLSCGYSRC